MSKKLIFNGLFSVTLIVLAIPIISSFEDNSQSPNNVKMAHSEASNHSSSSIVVSANNTAVSNINSNTYFKKLKLTSAGGGAYYINNDKPTISANISSSPWVHFSELDSLRRPGVANAWLNKSSRQYKSRTTTGNDSKIQPVGWHQMRYKGTWVYNRGHLLGYAIIGNVKGIDASEANYKNIVTQTMWANQSFSSSAKGQNYWEGKVRDALDKHKLVRYQVKPIYNGSELVPRGTQLQAVSKDKSVSFNVYVPNIQPNVKIDYKTGYLSAQS